MKEAQTVITSQHPNHRSQGNTTILGTLDMYDGVTVQTFAVFSMPDIFRSTTHSAICRDCLETMSFWTVLDSEDTLLAG